MEKTIVYYVQANNLANAVTAMKLLKFDPGPIQRTEVMYTDGVKLYSSESRKYAFGWGNFPSYYYIVFEFDKIPDDKTYQILWAFGHFYKESFPKPIKPINLNDIFCNLRSIV